MQSVSRDMEENGANVRLPSYGLDTEFEGWAIASLKVLRNRTTVLMKVAAL